jgi:hypothetical protein
VRTTNQQTATRARKQPQAKWEQEVYKTAIQAKCEQQINKQPQGLGHSHENKNQQNSYTSKVRTTNQKIATRAKKSHKQSGNKKSTNYLQAKCEQQINK